ncbi:copper amine oxidase N-terminal domain-containing protein [Ructibacterium gallinarum]|uniref:Copper amine oxidase N-terminal domain-containing protein n=1 Tax=Ructibacterium gallinarum TaxID=2779355 RepID=A0A9D5R934_9FIRM|nr:copper amine oxidase N-terminal domain-containing protein [Ructibacterium gallinarum]MBE5041036.1 copper amine oxidase N-terminal domain-containing protein [Ructibacterium gallinarum]
MKKIWSMLLMGFLVTAPCAAVAEEELTYDIGTYYQLGSYLDAPIVWKCIDNTDENGVLLVSDKILCYKAADVGETGYFAPSGAILNTNFWEETNIRAWLNSTAPAGEVVWPRGYPPEADRIFRSKYPYADEAGFLSEGNFTASELAVMKTVSQWQALPEYKLELSENGQTRPYLASYTTGSDRDPYTLHHNTVSEFGDAFRGAMYRVTDTMFLLNEAQVYAMWQNFGIAGAKRTDTAAWVESEVVDSKYAKYRQPAADEVSVDEYSEYWLRTPALDRPFDYWSDSRGLTTIQGENSYMAASTNAKELGIRPAFYLNTDNVIIKSGSGTETDPYVIDGNSVQTGVAVFSQGSQLALDQAPVEENGRLLVPVRAVFESLGAEVNWDEAANQVTAVKEGTTVQLEIDNATMVVNEAEVELEAPARLIGDRTLVPLRAVSEALDAKIVYVENLQRVVVDQPEPMVFSPDWNPSWYQTIFQGWDD